MNDLQIRDAQPSDREAIEAVTLSAYQEYAPLMPEYWEPYRQNILETLAAVRPAAQIVAEQQSRIVGTVLLYPAGAAIGSPESVAFTLTLPEVKGPSIIRSSTFFTSRVLSSSAWR